MKVPIRTCAPRFSGRRMVKEYVHRYYPALLAGTAAARVRGAGEVPVPAIAADERPLPVDGEA